MNLIFDIVFNSLIIILIYVIYLILSEKYFSNSTHCVMNYYKKKYKEYLRYISVFSEETCFIRNNNENEFLQKIKEKYQERKKEGLIISDELLLKNTINNIKNNNNSITPWVSSMITISVSIGIAILNIKKNNNIVNADIADIKVETLVYAIIVVMYGITGQIIISDVSAVSKSRKISFYQLLLEIIDKVKNDEFNNKKIFSLTQICEETTKDASVPRNKKFKEMHKFSELKEWWIIDKIFNFFSPIVKWILKVKNEIVKVINDIKKDMKLVDKLYLFISLIIAGVIGITSK